MSSEKKFGLLRNVLRATGLSQEAVDDAVNFIADLLTGESKGSKSTTTDFPYHLRDHFLSPAELTFYKALQSAVDGRAVILCKVALGDLFYVKKDGDMSRYRIYTNKIDRKHVDFLLCDSFMRPVVGIELDDKSHQREDRRARDRFVDGVFTAAKLPLVHVPVRRAYDILEIARQFSSYLGAVPTSVPAPRETIKVSVPSATTSQAPHCPKCGSEMILRTAKSGANAGNKFWGCSKYPSCKGITSYEGTRDT